jgi:hypothetical protein
VAYQDAANVFVLDQSVTRSGANAMITAARVSGASIYMQAQASVGVLNSSTTLRLSTGGNGRLDLTSSGHLIPSTTGVSDLGDATHQFRDIHLSRNAVIGGALDHDGGTAGVFGVTPAARVAARTITNDASSRTLDVSTATLAQLANFVATMARDLITYGWYQ